jgi:hypothetical protein
LHDLLQKIHDRLFNHQWIIERPGHNLFEQPPLGEVRGRVGPPAREGERSVRTRVKGRIKNPHYILHDIDFQAEPITPVSLDADCVSQVGLTLIVKGNHIRIGDKGRLVFMLNLDGGSWKHKATISCRSRIMKGWIIWMAAERTDPHHSAVKHNPIDCVSRGFRHATW